MASIFPVRAPRRRLDPATRREHIVEAARKVFAERPYVNVSMTEVAEAAGVARSLVHHYFGGMQQLFQEIVSDAATGLVEVREAGVETPLQERVETNVGAALDWIAENRQTWLAVAGHPGRADPQLMSIAAAEQERSVQRALALNADVISDTPITRLALSSFHAFTRETIKAWLKGEATREDAKALIATALEGLLTQTIPALERRHATSPSRRG